MFFVQLVESEPSQLIKTLFGKVVIAETHFNKCFDEVFWQSDFWSSVQHDHAFWLSRKS